jgi:hypothetical protein
LCIALPAASSRKNLRRCAVENYLADAAEARRCRLRVFSWHDEHRVRAQDIAVCSPGAAQSVSASSAPPSARSRRLSIVNGDQADPRQSNHSANASKETKAWLDAQPEGRFTFVFTPKHGSWLNLVEGFFSKLARSTLRHIRVASKQELKDWIIAAIDDINRDPVVHTWTYKINVTP